MKTYVFITALIFFVDLLQDVFKGPRTVTYDYGNTAVAIVLGTAFVLWAAYLLYSYRGREL